MKPSKYYYDISNSKYNHRETLERLDLKYIDREDEKEITKRYLELNLKDDYQAMKYLIEAEYKDKIKKEIGRKISILCKTSKYEEGIYKGFSEVLELLK